jgi:hypothetical protein
MRESKRKSGGNVIIIPKIYTFLTVWRDRQTVRWRIGDAPIVREISGSIPVLTTNFNF